MRAIEGSRIVGSGTLPGGPGVDARLDALLRRLDDLQAQQVAQRELLTRVLALLEARHAPRDASDRALIQVLSRSAFWLRFTAAEVFRHAAAVPALAEALEAADVESPRQLGRLLKRLAGVTVAGVQIDVVDEYHREGLVYRVREVRV